MTILREFLQRNDIGVSNTLPLVHSSRAFYLRSILGSGAIKCQPCDVFTNDSLNYFFVGRPAYKFELSANAEFWELPVCFVMNFGVLKSPKRRYPFDSGGFSKGRLPGFLKPFDMSSFEVSADANANEKIIGTFFGTPHNYMRHTPKKGINVVDQFDISMLEAELHALHRLSSTRDTQFDDRQFVIEEQYDQDVELNSESLSAIIIPDLYMEDSDFLDLADTYNCKVMTYNTFPVHPEAYYYAIYGHIETHLHTLGLL